MPVRTAKRCRLYALEGSRVGRGRARGFHFKQRDLLKCTDPGRSFLIPDKVFFSHQWFSHISKRKASILKFKVSIRSTLLASRHHNSLAWVYCTFCKITICCSTVFKYQAICNKCLTMQLPSSLAYSQIGDLEVTLKLLVSFDLVLTKTEEADELCPAMQHSDALFHY